MFYVYDAPNKQHAEVLVALPKQEGLLLFLFLSYMTRILTMENLKSKRKQSPKEKFPVLS